MLWMEEIEKIINCCFIGSLHNDVTYCLSTNYGPALSVEDWKYRLTHNDITVWLIKYWVDLNYLMKLENISDNLILYNRI